MPLEIGDPLLRCGYCHTDLYMVPSDGVFRYRLNSTHKIEDVQLLWLPFWRFRGLRYAVGPEDRLDTSLIDTTVGAHSTIPRDMTLGIAPQGAGVSLIASARHLPPSDISVKSAIMAADIRLRVLEQVPACFYRLVGETTSLIYAPFMVAERHQRDGTAVLKGLWGDGKTFSISLQQLEMLETYQDITSASPSFLGSGQLPRRFNIKFLPLICPECAAPLPKEPHALIVRCPICSEAYGIRGKEFARLEYLYTDVPGVFADFDTDICFLPFWVMSLDLIDFPLNNRAAIRRMLISWKRVPDRWEEEPVQLTMPAFKLNPGLYVKVAARMSIAAIDIPEENPHIPQRQPFFPVKLPVEEAAQAVKVVLFQMFRRRKRLIALIPKVKLRVREIRLLFLPFQRAGREMIQCHTGLAINRRALDLGDNV